MNMGDILVWILLVLGGLLLLLFLLLLLPLSLRLSFDGELKLRIRYCGIPVYRYPPRAGKKEKKKAPKFSKKKKKGQKPGKTGKANDKLAQLSALLREDGPSAVAAYLTELVRLTATGVRRLLDTVRMDRLSAELVVATGDAAETALQYGRLCGLVYPAEAALEGLLRIRRREITLRPDFLLEKGTAKLLLRAHALPLRLLIEVPRYLLALLKLGDTPEEELAENPSAAVREKDESQRGRK